jgi:hypothetical protein
MLNFARECVEEAEDEELAFIYNDLVETLEYEVQTLTLQSRIFSARIVSKSKKVGKKRGA